MDEYIKRTLAKGVFTGNFQESYSVAHIHALLDDVPAADVAPVKRGHWICNDDEDAPEWRKGTHCSVCHWGWSNHLVAVRLNPHWSLIVTPYCPNCGAVMENGHCK